MFTQAESNSKIVPILIKDINKPWDEIKESFTSFKSEKNELRDLLVVVITISDDNLIKYNLVKNKPDDTSFSEKDSSENTYYPGSFTMNPISILTTTKSEISTNDTDKESDYEGEDESDDNYMEPISIIDVTFHVSSSKSKKCYNESELKLASFSFFNELAIQYSEISHRTNKNGNRIPVDIVVIYNTKSIITEMYDKHIDTAIQLDYEYMKIFYEQPSLTCVAYQEDTDFFKKESNIFSKKSKKKDKKKNKKKKRH